MSQHEGERSFEEIVRQRAAEDPMIVIFTDFNDLDNPENLHYRAVKNGRTLYEWDSEPVEDEARCSAVHGEVVDDKKD